MAFPLKNNKGLISMKKFFNYLVCISVLLLGGLTGATFYISMDIEKMFYKKELFAYDNKIVSYKKIISYKKGLFESNAVTEVKLLNLPTAIKMHHTILHGPIIITKDPKKPIDFKFAIVKSYLDESANTAIPTSFVISTVLNYKKEIESTINSSFPKYTDNWTQIANLLLESFIHITNDYFDFKCTAAASSIQTNYLGNELVAEGIALKANQTVHSFDNGEGNVTINVEKIIQKQQETKITNLKLNTTNIFQNKLLNSSFDLDIEKITSKNEIYGPLHFKLLIENIDLSQISVPQPNYTSLLLKKPKLIIDNSYLSLSQGVIKVNLALSFSELESNSNNISANAALPIEMQRVGIDGEVSLIISKEILKQMLTKSIENGLVTQMEYEKFDLQKKQQELDMQVNVNLQQAIQNGTLIEKEGTYETKIIITQNNFIVNDKPIIVPSVLFINYMKMFKASHVAGKNSPVLLQQPK